MKTLDWEDEEVDEDRQAYDDMRADLESGECVVIQGYPSRPDEVWFCGKHLCTLGEKKSWWCGNTEMSCELSWDGMMRRIRKEMDRQKYWPNVYSVNERGNVTLLSMPSGKEVRGWV